MKMPDDLKALLLKFYDYIDFDDLEFMGPGLKLKENTPEEALEAYKEFRRRDEEQRKTGRMV